MRQITRRKQAFVDDKEQSKQGLILRQLHKLPCSSYQLIFILASLVSTSSWSQLTECKAVLKNDTLLLENNKIRRCFLWKDGDFKSIRLENKVTNQTITAADTVSKGDVSFPGIMGTGSGGTFRVYNVTATPSGYAYLAAEATVHFAGLELKRIFKLYAGCPAIACDYYLKGKAGDWKNILAEGEALKNIEDEASKKSGEGKILMTDNVPVSGNHWKIKSVEFFDASDYNNTFVQVYERLIYRQENRLRGNLLFATNPLGKAGFFILKEAPVSASQLYYQGFDFTAVRGAVKVAGMGISPKDLSDSGWVKGYSVVVGVGEEKGERGLTASLRNYQNHQRIYREDRDGMIVSNTWGDRNRDSRINESFIMQEIDAGARLGITHLQIDDGWQVGRSSNSAFKGGSLANIWRNERYWNVDSAKFPHGLAPVIDAAKKKGMKVSLWFNPAADSSLAHWENDADALIAQYKNYGLSMWKIDGVQVTDKKGETAYRNFLDKVTAATNYDAVFNQDITAGRRFGYHYLNTYGNFYLENRYTDWTNYYPHTTLRNLWQLSAYVPPQRFQIEFLNNRRNAGRYPADDVLAPAVYSLDYLFAITMVAQPLAFFEVSNLPAESPGISKIIHQYKTIAKDLHAGDIFPIGDEPDGFSWTGFQSIQKASGYFLVFRENNAKQEMAVKTHLPGGKKTTMRLVAGEGKSFHTVTGEGGNIVFKLPNRRTFALYAYTLR